MQNFIVSWDDISSKNKVRLKTGILLLLMIQNVLGYLGTGGRSGVKASFEGGTEVLVLGSQFAHYPLDNRVRFTYYQGSEEFTIPGPALSTAGKLQYTLPALDDLFDKPMSDFDSVFSIDLYLSILKYVPDTNTWVWELVCSQRSNCKISYTRNHTPLLHHLSSPVVYKDLKIGIYVDPRKSQELLSEEENFMSEARFDGVLMDFEDIYEDQFRLDNYNKQQVVGIVGDQLPNATSEFNIKFKAGNSMPLDYSLKVCDYSNSKCYKAKTVPKIDSISADQGFTSGGQKLTISGHGLEPLKDASVMVAGVECSIVKTSLNSIECITGANPTTSQLGQYVGQHGLRRQFYYREDGQAVGLSDIETNGAPIANDILVEETLLTHFETVSNQADGFAQKISGYFKAPTTGKYKFFLSGDDDSKLYLSKTNLDPSAKELIANINGYSSYRNYNKKLTQISAEIDLEQDNYYYIEAVNQEGGGEDHLTVSVQIEQSTITDHQQSTKEIQRFVIQQTNIFEMSKIIITNPDEGSFKLKIWNQEQAKYWESIEFKAISSEGQLKDAIEPFFKETKDSKIHVERKLFDSSDEETTNKTETVRIEYNITLRKLISSSPLSGDIQVQAINTTTASLTFETAIVPSSPPLSGFFRIQGINEDTSTCTTADIPYNSKDWEIKDAIIDSCPNYRDILVWDSKAMYEYYENGREFYIKFVGMNRDIAQFELLDGSTPDKVLQGDNPQRIHSTYIPYSTDLFYEPAPFEYLFTDETLPQVIVTIDSLPAVCAGMSCSYSYIQTSMEITSVSLNGLTLTMDGQNLPAQNSHIEEITYSNVKCNIQGVVSDTQIQCILEGDPVAGTSWLPKVRTLNGLIPVTDTAKQQALEVTSIVVDEPINPLGNQILVINGRYFPHSITSPDQIDISFTDSTKCLVSSVSPTEIHCVTQKFTTTGQSQDMTLNVNGQTNTQSLQIGASAIPILSISPSSVSPVLKTDLVITIDPSYQGSMANGIFTVTISNSLSGYFKTLRVFNIDAGNKQLDVAFGGAPSDTYDISVKEETYGQFDTTGIQLVTEGIVLDFNPKSGSIHGGTLITISGINFSNNKLDNNVRIGNTDCLVTHSSHDEIKCRTQVKEDLVSEDQTLLVFLKAAEEAQCDLSDCLFTWEDASLPTIQGYSASYDQANDYYKLIITGQGFTGDVNSIELHIDDVPQRIISKASDEIVVEIIDIKTTKSDNVQLYFPEGRGNNYLSLQSINLSPAIVSVTPNIGSPGGHYLKVRVAGVGKETKDLQLFDSSNNPICEKIEITDFEEVLCLTLIQSITTPQNIKVKVGDGNSMTCANINPTQCQYSTMPIAPTISLTSVASNVLTITGDGFPTIGFSAEVIYEGIKSSSTSIDSINQVTATFSDGIPNFENVVIKLLFRNTGNGDQYFVVNDPPVLTTNPLVITDSSLGLQCSFAGGCELQITADGLKATLKSPNQNAYIDICGQECKFQESTSTESVAKCLLPALATKYSADHFQIQKVENLKGSKIGSDLLQAELVFDGINTEGWQDNTANCYFGIELRSGLVGVLRSLQIFMNPFVKENFVDQLVLQGSNDNFASFTDIQTISAEIHEGWNYYDFQQGSEPTYNSYRLFGSHTGSCQVGEVAFYGLEVLDDDQPSIQCTPKVIIDGVETSANNDVTYIDSQTPVLTSISPNYGSVTGNTIITFEGTRFDPVQSNYKILIDNVECPIEDAGLDFVKCKTQPREGKYETPTLSIVIDGKGAVATQGKTFLYGHLWSDPVSWGNEFPPEEGESVHIEKGVNMIVDISPPILNAVIVEGALIFPPNSENPSELRTFDAHYIYVRHGLFQVGTEDAPYDSKLTITMHGTKKSPELPLFGNKVLAVEGGTLDLHGKAVKPTWTELQSTADIGATSITLKEKIEGWNVGDTIVIAPSSYYNVETEERIITGIDHSSINNPVLTFDEPLKFKHFAGIQQFDANNFIEMRAEVGLLTRNVLFRGDPESSDRLQYGAQIMLHSKGEDSSVGRISYIELTNVGQAFQLGRYPIHFHMIGNLHKSYILGNSVHHTFNRAFTVHAVHYLRLQKNVAYKSMGHTYFIEDAIETKNVLEDNIAFYTRKSMSLLNTDMTPASYWITNPYNYFRRNHAAGSDKYGFWFDLQTHPTGPSFDSTICPINMPLGEFTSNVAHSNIRYGVRVHSGLMPRLYPCKAIDDIDQTNPSITAVFKDIVSYKNGRNGFIMESSGNVIVENLKAADNILAGAEYSVTDVTFDGAAQINGALIVGHSNNADDETLSASPHGIITPRTENFQVHNVTFYNFDLNNMAALGSCSHCFHSAATDSGARTVTFSGLKFFNVLRKIRYQTPYRAIYYDLDGSLTSLGNSSWATANWVHNYQPNECQFDTDTLNEYDGPICNNDVQVRRIVFYQYKPQHFEGMELKILQWDQAFLDTLTPESLTDYLENEDNYSIVPFKPKTNPKNAWAIPFVTNHRYKIHWRNGLDFEQMRITLSEKWNENDHNLYLVMNFTDQRERVEFNFTGPSPDLMSENETLTTIPEADLQTGDNVVYNDTETREIHTVINGKNMTHKSSFKMFAYRCFWNCHQVKEYVDIEEDPRYWSDPTSWTNGQVPTGAEDLVEIEPGWNMVYDIEDSPILKMIEINGRLSFLNNGTDRKLSARYIWVRMGELLIGSQDTPFSSKAEIVLVGEQQTEHLAIENLVETGNKVLINTALVDMHGVERIKMSRLQQSASIGDSVIYLEDQLDWKEGDEIALAPTSNIYLASEKAKIVSYDINTGQTVLEQGLQNFYFGDSVSTETDYGIDMRGEVFLLTRNVIIRGSDENGWGGQVVTSDFLEADGETRRKGYTYMDYVEIRNCSQRDTYKAALRFERSRLGESLISNSAIHGGLGRGLQIFLSQNIELKGNVFYDFSVIGINVQTSDYITLDGNALIRVTPRDITALDAYNDPKVGFCICAFNYGDVCNSIKIKNNLAAGVDYAGFATMGHNCDAYDETFQNNIAHSVNGIGAIIYPDFSRAEQKRCYEASYFKGYKNVEEGAIGFFESLEFRMSHMVLVDNGYSLNVMLAHSDSLTTDKAIFAKARDIKIYGDSPAKDCQVQNQCQTANKQGLICQDKYGMMFSTFSTKGKEPIPRKATNLPLHKIKGDAPWGGITDFKRIEIREFPSDQTWCGKQRKAFLMNPSGADYHPIQNFERTVFHNVHDDALAYLMDPPVGWANIADCGNIPCTGPLNLISKFTASSFTGSVVPLQDNADFQMISNNEQVAPVFDCRKKSAWNGYYCQDTDLSLLLFESQDADRFDRTVSPVVIESNQTGIFFGNAMNSFMDHRWDGFYTSQKRLSRFVSIIKARGPLYEVIYSGTPPVNQRFKLIAEQSSIGIIIRIDYPKAEVYQISVNNQVVPSNPWDEQNGEPMAISGANGCGENRFVGVQNILEFALMPGCNIYISQLESIQTSIRLDWTFEQFFEHGGTTNFVDRIAASLGIHPSQIKTAKVYEGSVIVEFFIINPSQGEPKVLAALETKLRDIISNGKLDLGAPILDASINSSPVISSDEQDNNDPDPSQTGGTSEDTIDIVEPPIVEQDESFNWGKASIVLGIVMVILIVLALIAFLVFRLMRKSNVHQQVAVTSPDRSSKVQIKIEDETYEPQYHPKSDIGDLIAPKPITNPKIKELENIMEAHIEQESQSKEDWGTFQIDSEQQEYPENDPRGNSLLVEQTPLTQRTKQKQQMKSQEPSFQMSVSVDNAPQSTHSARQDVNSSRTDNPLNQKDGES